MGESKHTPGKWEAVFEDDPRGQPVPYYRGLICIVQDGDERISVVASDGRTSAPDEWRGNGRLIAAAPELLEALRKIAEGQYGQGPAVRQIARAAILAATGGQP